MRVAMTLVAVIILILGGRSAVSNAADQPANPLTGVALACATEIAGRLRAGSLPRCVLEADRDKVLLSWDTRVESVPLVKATGERVGTSPVETPRRGGFHIHFEVKRVNAPYVRHTAVKRRDNGEIEIGINRPVHGDDNPVFVTGGRFGADFTEQEAVAIVLKLIGHSEKTP